MSDFGVDNRPSRIMLRATSTHLIPFQFVLCLIQTDTKYRGYLSCVLDLVSFEKELRRNVALTATRNNNAEPNKQLNLKGNTMNKLIAALMAGFFAVSMSSAFAEDAAAPAAPAAAAEKPAAPAPKKAKKAHKKAEKKAEAAAPAAADAAK